MIFELIGTFMAGLVTGLFVFGIRRLAPNFIPKWLIPVGAGAAMLVATISSEYGWFGRTTATMPEGFVVAQSIEEAVFYRPWTYLAPLTSRFVAVDTNSVRTNESLPDQRIVDLYFYGRWAAINTVPILFDCASERTATLIQDVEFNEDGSVSDADWSPMASDDPVFVAACTAG